MDDDDGLRQKEQSGAENELIDAARCLMEDFEYTEDDILASSKAQYLSPMPDNTSYGKLSEKSAIEAYGRLNDEFCMACRDRPATQWHHALPQSKFKEMV